jgi:hypothetical protein
MVRARPIAGVTGARFVRPLAVASWALRLALLAGGVAPALVSWLVAPALISSVAHAGHSTQPPETERAGNVLFLRPSGWQRHDDPDGTVRLIPPDVSARQVALTINPGRERPGGDLRQAFDASWHAILQANGARVVSGGDVRGGRRRGADALSTSAVLQSTSGTRIHTAFFVTAPGTRVESVLFVAASDALYARYIEPVLEFMATVRFANLES